jgi:hypothetical protein
MGEAQRAVLPAGTGVHHFQRHPRQGIQDPFELAGNG